MANTPKQPGLDDRHRNVNGRIERKHGNTRVDTLRRKYGSRVPEDVRGDMKLSALLLETNTRSLSQLLKRNDGVDEDESGLSS